MSILKALTGLLALIAIPGLLGCEVRALPGPAAAPPQANQQPGEPGQPGQPGQPGPPGQQGPPGQTEVVIIHEAPPARRVEHRMPAPSPDRVWIDGYWAWNGHEYVWVDGNWAVPPHAHAVWQAPRYDRHEHGFRFVVGSWSVEGGR